MSTTDNTDKILKELISTSLLGESENLTHRILHQIKAEEALRPKKITKPDYSISDMRSLLFGMCAVLLIFVLIGYFNFGKTFYTTPLFLIPMLAVCCGYSLIFFFTTWRNSKHS
ncbi:MAG TPA: hypothetical protein PLP27_01485 [Crocinitomicaceae bacterium]|nr:hypothetical protein [Crocinitomicaceae bacterium]